MAPTTTHRTRVRPSPCKSNKSPRRRGVAAGYDDSDNDEDVCTARYLVSVRSAKVRLGVNCWRETSGGRGGRGLVVCRFRGGVVLVVKRLAPPSVEVLAHMERA